MKGAIVETEKVAAGDHHEVAALLSQVRAMLPASGCANKINAEKWLTAWLDTSHDALGGLKPQRRLELLPDGRRSGHLCPDKSNGAVAPLCDCVATSLR